MLRLKFVFLLLVGVSFSCSIGIGEPLEEEPYQKYVTDTKELYFSNGAYFYESAAQDCVGRFGGHLATIQTDEELRKLRDWLDEAGGTTAWVGAVLKDNASCRRPQKFNPSCWQWMNEGEINTELVNWSSSTANRQQSRSSRVIFDGYELNLVPNTGSFRSFCETLRDPPPCPEKKNERVSRD